MTALADIGRHHRPTRERPMSIIEEAALLRNAKRHHWRIREILNCIIFMHPEDHSKKIVVSKNTLRWKKSTDFIVYVGLVSLAQSHYGWSTANTIRKLAKWRRSERRRNELQFLINEVKTLYKGKFIPEEVEHFLKCTEEFIEQYSTISHSLLVRVRNEFIWIGLGFEKRLDALFEYPTEDMPPGLSDAIGSILKHAKKLT